MSTTIPVGPPNPPPWQPIPIDTRPTKEQHIHYHQASDDLRHELREANAELQRHHRDFGRIVSLLDTLEAGELEYDDFIRRMRNIVG